VNALALALSPLSLLSLGPAWAGGLETPRPVQAVTTQTRDEQNAAWIEELARVHHLDDAQVARIREIVGGSELLSQGNPALTLHPMTRSQCQEKLASAGVTWTDPASEATCGDVYMAPLYDPASQTAADATTCIDRMEFPDIPCAYPVVWVRAEEAEELCLAEGKRLCDAHEWEGACDGSLQPPDYRFDLAKGVPAVTAVQRMRAWHNLHHDKQWSYGPAFQTGVCAQDSAKTAGCNGGSWTGCGSNTYPTGAFPQCASALGVTDLNGNAAEHMNLPLAPDQLASAGTKLGVTEMKGSWFIWDKYRAHEDWCRWRAPYWHGGPVMSSESHRNYHLGFRCCKDVGAPSSPEVDHVSPVSP